MHALNAYKQQQDRSMTRIELILAMYRKAMENLAQARQALMVQRPENARLHLLKTQLIVSALASELPAYRDEISFNFLRLYEFVVRQIASCTIENIDAATSVLRPLQEGFEAVREQALALERQGVIPPLDRPRAVSVCA